MVPMGRLRYGDRPAAPAHQGKSMIMGGLLTL